MWKGSPAHYKRSKHTVHLAMLVDFQFCFLLFFLFFFFPCIPLLGLWRRSESSIAISYKSISVVLRSQGYLLLFPQLIYKMPSHHFQGAFTPLHACCSSFYVVAVPLNQSHDSISLISTQPNHTGERETELGRPCQFLKIYSRVIIFLFVKTQLQIRCLFTLLNFSSSSSFICFILVFV